MTTATLVPLTEYLRTVYHPDAEWLEGHLQERATGERSHAFIQTFFIKYFLAREEQWKVQVTQELRMQVSADKYRIPDVMVLRGDAPFEEIVRAPPLLCIEVLAPEDRMTEMQDRIEDYLTMGVSAVWIVNPKRRTGFVVDGAALLPVEDLTVSGTAIRVPVSEIFAGLDALKARSAS